MNGGVARSFEDSTIPQPYTLFLACHQKFPPTDKRMGARETDPILTLLVPPAMNRLVFLGRQQCRGVADSWLPLFPSECEGTAEGIGRWWLRGEGIDVDTESVRGSLAYLVKQGRPPVAAPVAVSLTL